MDFWRDFLTADKAVPGKDLRASVRTKTWSGWMVGLELGARPPDLVIPADELNLVEWSTGRDNKFYDQHHACTGQE